MLDDKIIIIEEKDLLIIKKNRKKYISEFLISLFFVFSYYFIVYFFIKPNIFGILGLKEIKNRTGMVIAYSWILLFMPRLIHLLKILLKGEQYYFSLKDNIFYKNKKNIFFI